MGEKEIKSSTKDLTLEEIIDSEIFPPQNNFFRRAKQRIEKTIIHHKNKIIIPISTSVGIASYYYTSKAMEGLVDIAKIFNPQATIHDLPPEYGPITGFSAGYCLYIYLSEKIKKYVGEKIIGIKKRDENKKKKKENFMYTNRLGLAIASGTIYATYFTYKIQENLQGLPQSFKESFNQNIDKFVYGFSPLLIGMTGLTYIFFTLMGKKAIFQKDSMKEIQGQFINKFSKKLAISYWENKSKEGLIYADLSLAFARDNIDEKLDYEKKAMERIKEEKIYYGKDESFIKSTAIGYQYCRLRKGNPHRIISIAMAIYPSNPDRAIRFLNKLSEVKSGENRTGILSARNYFMNIHEADKKQDWEELIKWLEKEGKLRLIEGSEGRTSSFFDDFTNKNFIFKEYGEDKSDKFFIEREILKILKGSDIKVENPLFFYNEEKVQKQVFIRDGEKNLREFLEDKNQSERRTAFEKVIRLLLQYQKIFSSTLEKNDSGFLVNAEFRGENRRIIIPEPNLDETLLRRAFLGSEIGEIRLGKNAYLPSLLNKIKEYDQENKFNALRNFNRGDTTAANITETLCIIDIRPCISHPLYDLVYISGDPIFTSLNFNSRKEKVIETYIKETGLKNSEADLLKAFDSLYLNLSLCNAGANLYMGKKDLSMVIIDDLLEFSKEKIFEKELTEYLKHSNIAP